MLSGDSQATGTAELLSKEQQKPSETLCLLSNLKLSAVLRQLLATGSLSTSFSSLLGRSTGDGSSTGSSSGAFSVASRRSPLVSAGHGAPTDMVARRSHSPYPRFVPVQCHSPSVRRTDGFWRPVLASEEAAEPVIVGEGPAMTSAFAIAGSGCLEIVGL